VRELLARLLANLDRVVEDYKIPSEDVSLDMIYRCVDQLYLELDKKGVV